VSTRVPSARAPKRPPPEGPPGVTANLPPGAMAASGVETSEENETIITNYDLSVVERETVTEPGRVERYIVSAIIEGDYEDAQDEGGNPVLDENGNTEQVYLGLKPERKQVYENYLRAAVGDGQVATEITVDDHPFKIDRLVQTRVAMAGIETAQFRQKMLQYGIDAGKVLLILLGFLLVRRYLRRAITVGPEKEEDEMAAEMPYATPEDRRRREVAVEVERMAVEEPETVAALLRSWMAEDQ